MVMVAGIRFKKAGKIYSFDAGSLELASGDNVIVEVEKGIGLGKVVNAPLAKDEAKITYKLKKIVRKADKVDLERDSFNSEREKEAYKVCKERIEFYKLPMKLVGVEYMFDSSKAIFYFTAENRVDFRELVKELASKFYTRIEMRQIGVRDEAKYMGGVGPCGQELCCARFLVDFEPVTVKMAKDQHLALNPQKISGLCGRLMCCLSYEHEGPKGKRDRPKGDAKHGEGKQDGNRAGHNCSGCDGGKHGGKHHHGRHDNKQPRHEEKGGRRDEQAGGAVTQAQQPVGAATVQVVAESPKEEQKEEQKAEAAVEPGEKN